MTKLRRWRKIGNDLKLEAYCLYLAAKDPRTPWYAKALVVCVVGYALSPIDLIPDFIPILGYLDDLIIVSYGMALAARLVPRDVLDDCRHSAATFFIRQGDSPVILQKILWHTSLVVTQNYLHMSTKDMVDVYGRFNPSNVFKL